MADFARRHYEVVARIIQAQHTTEHPEWDPPIDGIRDDFIALFERDNPRFDRARFERACEPGANVRKRT